MILRRRRRIREPHADKLTLLTCALEGHALAGVGARELRPQDASFAVQRDGERWHRCLRCDVWVVLPTPLEPTSDFPPDSQDLPRPPRDEELRELFVLRLIAVNRAFHAVVLLLAAGAIFAFSATHNDLRRPVFKVIADLGGGTGGGTGQTHGFGHTIDRLFSFDSGRLRLFAAVALAYATIEATEAVGLWRARRWAEYLTALVTASLLPLEIFEIVHHATPFKVVALIINVVILVYLVWDKGLFGVPARSKGEHALLGG